MQKLVLVGSLMMAMMAMTVAACTATEEEAEKAEPPASAPVAPESAPSVAIQPPQAGDVAAAPGSAVGALADEPCLEYCTGGGRSPFLTCVPVCRKPLGPVFQLELPELQRLPVCGDKVCQYPAEADRASPYYCPRDCIYRIELSPTHFLVEGKLIAEIKGSGVILQPSAFDSPL
jgi:hypothetical protein